MKRQEEAISQANLEKYFQHIGLPDFTLSGALLEDLKKVIRNHLNTFIYENRELYQAGSVPTNQRIIPPLEINALSEKMLATNGGYCFQHLELFYAVLHALGFQVERYLAKIILQPYSKLDPGKLTKAKTHEFLIVPIDNKRYIVDVGMCNTSLRSFLELKEGEQLIGFDHYQLIQKQDIWMLCTKADGKADWLCIYQFYNNPLQYDDIAEAHRNLLLTEESIPIREKILIGSTTDHKRKHVSWCNNQGLFKSVKDNGEEKNKKFANFEETAACASKKFRVSIM